VGRIPLSLIVHIFEFFVDEPRVEQRRESRLNVSKAARLKVLDRMAGPSLGRAMDAEIVDVSGSGMRLRTKVPVPCGAPVEVDDCRLLLLGEICRCTQDPDGSYTVGLRVFETLVSSDSRESSPHSSIQENPSWPARS
jgi:hypothetical protein